MYGKNETNDDHKLFIIKCYSNIPLYMVSCFAAVNNTNKRIIIAMGICVYVSTLCIEKLWSGPVTNFYLFS